MNVIVAAVVTGAMGIGMCFAIVSIYLHRVEIRPFLKDVIYSFTNGLFGIIGVCCYILNVPIFSRIETLDFLSDSLLVPYAINNTVRFMCWYCEFVCTFLLLTFFSNTPITLTFLRYTFHTINFMFSVSCFALAIRPDFPSRSLPGYDTCPPEVWQSVIMHYVFASYYFISTSKLHRFDKTSAFTTYALCFEFLSSPFPRRGCRC